MKKTIEIDCCDVCGLGAAHHNCPGCGKYFCYDCSEKHGHHYPVSLVFSNTKFVCNDCCKENSAGYKKIEPMLAFLVKTERLIDSWSDAYKKLTDLKDKMESDFKEELEKFGISV